MISRAETTLTFRTLAVGWTFGSRARPQHLRESRAGHDLLSLDPPSSRPAPPGGLPMSRPSVKPQSRGLDRRAEGTLARESISRLINMVTSSRVYRIPGQFLLLTRYIDTSTQRQADLSPSTYVVFSRGLPSYTDALRSRSAEASSAGSARNTVPIHGPGSVSQY